MADSTPSNFITVRTKPAILPQELQSTKPSLETLQKEHTLNEKQELFCKLYATNREFFGNGVQTYLEIYKPNRSQKGWYNVACAASSRLLSNVKVSKRINELLENTGLNDQFVDKQLLFLITQHTDFRSKLGAIKEYNALKRRIVKRMEATGKDGEPLLPIPILGGLTTDK